MHQRETISPLVGAHTEEIDTAALRHRLGDITPTLLANIWIKLDLTCREDDGVHHDGEIREGGKTRAEHGKRVVQPQRRPSTLVDSPSDARDRQFGKRTPP
jgi:hypothetical protein